MLVEIDNPRQNADEHRRVFHDEYFDLYIWLDRDESISGFQLCYDKSGAERALTWRNRYGYSHEKVDTGENISGHFKMKPILVDDGLFDNRTIAERFRAAGANIDADIVDFVYRRLREYT